MTTYLLRHASTSYSTGYLVNGNPSVRLPLNAEGVAACHRLRSSGSLSDSRTWITSAFPRTQQTAALLAGPTQAESRTEVRLNELDYGDFEGGPFVAYAAWLGQEGPWARPPGSTESQREAFARMVTGVQDSLRHSGPRVIIAHGLLLSLFTWALSEPPGTAIPLFFPEAPCLDPLVTTDAQLHSLTGRLIGELHLSRTYAKPTGGDWAESGRKGMPILANFDPLRTSPQEKPPHA